MMRIRYTFLLLVTSSWLSGLPSEDISAEYIVSALEQLDNGRQALTERLIETALEYNPVSSDALHLRARIASGTQEKTLDAMRDLEIALLTDQFDQTERVAALALYGQLLNRVGRHAEAVDLLDGVRAGATESRHHEADVSYELAVANREIGRERVARAVAEASRDAFPEDARFVGFLLGGNPYPDLEFRREIDRLLDRSRSERSGAPEQDGAIPQPLLELLLSYARRAPTASERRWASSRYLGLGGVDPIVLETVVDYDVELARDLFLRWEAFRSLALMTSDAIDELLADARVRRAVESADGVLLMDADRDGYWTERIEVADGVISNWGRDENQDGVTEIEIGFEEGVPRSAHMEGASATLGVRYSLYPFVESVEVAIESGVERFILRPRAVDLPLLSTLDETGATLSRLPSLESRAPLSLDELRVASTAIELEQTEPPVRTRSYHVSGTTIHVAVDQNGDGTADAISVHQNGFRQQAASDIDFDGYFEIIEAFRNGVRVARAVDEDHNGFPELYEREEGIHVKEWDLNEDGRIDVREFERWKDSVVRDFPLLLQDM